jgi:hypothetical protein
VVGGGVRGKGGGIARGTIAQVGATIETFHLFIEKYHQVGGMTIGNIVGEVINGTPNEYPTKKSNGTGVTGKRVDIGRSNILGVCRVCNLGHNPERATHPERLSHTESLKENRQKNSIKKEGRTISLLISVWIYQFA